MKYMAGGGGYNNLGFFITPRSCLRGKAPLGIGCGLALLRLPDYRGSDENRYYVLPFPYSIYRGDILRVDRERISGRIFKTDRLLLDVSLYGSVPVDSSRNSARSGMPVWIRLSK